MLNFRKFGQLQFRFGSRIAQALFSGMARKSRSRQSLVYPESLAYPELLEVRQLLSAVMSTGITADENPLGTLSVTLDSGLLTVTDVSSSATNNGLAVMVVGTDLVVSDANEQFISAPTGGTLSNDGKTLTVPLSLITSGLTIDAGSGDDVIDIQSIDAAFSANLIIDGGSGSDAVTFQSSAVNVGAGSVNVAAETINVNTALTAGGAVNLTSTGDDTTLTIAAAITAGANSKFTADKMLINSTVDVGANVLTLVPESTVDAGDFIDIGATLDSTANTLQLSDAELDRITAAMINIGDTATSTVTISGTIQHAGDSHFQVVSGRNIVFNPGSGWTTGENSSLSFTAETAATGGGNLFGIEMNNATLTSVGGNIALVGHGGNGGDNNFGIYLHDGSAIRSMGNGAIALTGVGGSGTSDNRGIQIANSSISSVAGDIDITGRAGGGTLDNQVGVWIVDGATISGAGNSRVRIEGTGGSGANEGDGILLNGFGVGGETRVTVENGDLTMFGYGATTSTGANNRGIGIYEGAVIESIGTGSITVIGMGGGGTDSARGVEIAHDGTLITSAVGNIQITGSAGVSSTGTELSGVCVLGGATIQSTGTAQIVIGGVGGTGRDSARGVEIGDAGTRITSAVGDITITGQGGAVLYGFGIWVRSGAVIESTGTAKITLNGTGGGSDEGNGSGIFFGGYGSGGATLTSADGDINIIGQGGSSSASSYNPGVGMFEGSVVQSTGTARISIDGTGGSGTDSERGVEIGDTGTKVTSLHGDISITGQGGTGSSMADTNNIGVWIRDNAVVESTATEGIGAKITIDGTAGTGTGVNIGVWIKAGHVVSHLGDIQVTGEGASGSGTYNNGVNLQDAGSIVSTGTAKITIDGVGGDGTGNLYGVSLSNDSFVQSVNGDIQVTGWAGSGGDTNIGVTVQSRSYIESTGTAKISVHGIGGQGTSPNHGVVIAESGTYVRSEVGDIAITGISRDETGNFNNGVHLENARIISTGTAQIAVNGDARAGSGGGQGVYIAGADAAVQSWDGDILITGTGGTGGGSNIGMSVQNGAVIESLGNAKINITGIGGKGTYNAQGVWIFGADTVIRSAVGNIQLSGGGGDGTEFLNVGVLIQGGAVVSSTGTAEVYVIGAAGTGIFHEGLDAGQIGVWVDGAGSKITSKDGDIYIAGTGGGDVGSSGNDGVLLRDGVVETTGVANVWITGTPGVGTDSFGIQIESSSGSIGVNTSAGAGIVQLISDAINIDSGALPGAIDAGAGTVYIEPNTNGVEINLGGADASGILGLTDAELDRITARMLVISIPWDATLTVSADVTRPVATGMSLYSMGNLVISGGFVDTHGGLLALIPWIVAPAVVNPSHAGLDVSALETTLYGDLLIALNGLVVDTGYTQFNVAGGVNLNDVNLQLSGSYMPSLNDSFLIVNNDGNDAIVSTFNGLAEGAILNFNGRELQISYVGGDGNDVVLTTVNVPPVAADGTLSTNEDTPGSGMLVATDVGSPSLTYSIVTNPSHGTVIVTNATTGAYTYTPDANYNGPDSFTFKANDGTLDSNLATVSITINAVNDVPQLNLNGGPVTFNKKTTRKDGPTHVVPNVTVVDPDQSPGQGVGGGTLTVSIDVATKTTKRSIKLYDTIGGLSNASTLGMATTALLSNGKLVLTIQLNDGATTASIQAFLRGITFSTKGPGLKQAQRMFQAQLTDAAGATSNVLQQTVNVTRK